MYMVCNFFALEKENCVCVTYDLMLFVFLLQKDI